MKKTIKWLIISFSSVLLLVGMAVLLFFILLTPKRLTPLVNKYCTEFLNATVTFDTVYVSLFEEFPKVSVKLIKGEVISHALQSDTAFWSVHPEGVDTLLRFNELMVSLNAKDLMQSKFNIERIRISQPVVYAYISPSGAANFDIVTPSDNDTPLDLNIDRISIRGPAKVHFQSCPDSMNIQATIGRMFVKGNLVLDLDALKINKFVCANIQVNADMEKNGIRAFLDVDSVNFEALELNKLVCANLKVNADIIKSNINAGVDIVSAEVNFNEQKSEFNLKIDGLASAKIDKQLNINTLPFTIDGGVKLDIEKLDFFGFNDFRFTVAELPGIKLNGELHVAEGEINSDLICKLEKFSLQEVIDAIPENFSKEIKKIKTDVNISVSTKIKGTYEFAEKGKLPMVDIDFKIPKGYLIYKDLASKIDNIAVDASFHFDPASPKKTGIKLKTINVDAFAMNLNGNMDISNLFVDPKVTMKMSGAANLREVMKYAPENLGITARGNLSFVAEGSFLLSKLNQQELAKNDLVVNFSADKLRVRIPKDSISILVERTTFELNTTKTRTSRTNGEIRRQLTVDFKSDTARIRLPSREIIAFSKVDFTLRTSDALITGDTSKVISMGGSFSANTLEYITIDSSSVRLADVKSNVRIFPSRENRSMPSIRFDIETKQARALAEGSRFSVRDASITLSATKIEPPQRSGQRGNRNNRADDDFRGDDINIKNAKLGAMLREWNVTGSIKSRTGRVVTPYFPLRTRLQNVDIAFTTNDITLQNMDIKCGESRFNINAKIDNIRRALSYGRGLKIDATIKADTLNFNQLITTVFNGASYTNSSDEYKKSVGNASDEEHLEKIIQKENEGKEEKPVLFVVPSNITMDINVDVGYAKYANVTINKLNGSLVSRDRCIQLKDFNAKTSLGDINLTALYATRSKKDITFGVDLEFKEIQVGDFIKIIPSIDSLVPMLNSFQGVVNAQIAATAHMDTTMNIILPTLNAACRISGKNLVLLDGETFSSIAKTLKFKNRERNLVDKISVELLVKNNQIEIFPFLMEIDRYKTAISGVHNLDMTFNYHISVLQSPIPFRLGINLKGDLDDMSKMKFGLGKAKYKDTNLPSYVTIIDTTRLNLRTQIDNFIHQGVDLARFSQFSAPKIDPTLIETETEATIFSAQDSLMLFKEGIIDVAPKSLLDSVPSEGNKPRRGRGSM